MSRESEQEIKLKWLFKVRWGVLFASFLAFVSAKWLFDLSIDLWPYLVLFSLAVVVNSIFYLQLNSIKIGYETLVKTALVFDLILLTAFLYFYGGHTNPFSTLYLVYIILAASLLNNFWIWAIYLASSILFALLFVFYVPVSELSMHAHHAGHGFTLHLYGMLLGFILIGALLSFFLSKIGNDLRRAKKTARNLREKQIEDSKLLALASLTAGTAHELSTPLATIKLTVESLRDSQQHNIELEADLASLEHELQRCEKVLSRMRLRGPELSGETPSLLKISSIQSALEANFQKDLSRIDFINFNQDFEFKTLADSLTESVRALLENGLEASSLGQKVEIEFMPDAGRVVFTVRDRGEGIEPALIARIGEPFLTTKSDGIGLGLFLVKLFARRVAGSLEVESTKTGTQFVLSLPVVGL